MCERLLRFEIFRLLREICKSVTVRPKRSLFAQCSAAVIGILTWTSLTLLTVGCQGESSTGANIYSVPKTWVWATGHFLWGRSRQVWGPEAWLCFVLWLVVIVNELGHRRSRCQKQGWTVGPFAVESWFLFFSHSNSSFSFHLRTFMKEITMPQEIAVAACALSEWRVAGIPKRNTSKQVLRSCTSRIHFHMLIVPFRYLVWTITVPKDALGKHNLQILGVIPFIKIHKNT